MRFTSLSFNHSMNQSFVFHFTKCEISIICENNISSLNLSDSKRKERRAISSTIQFYVIFRVDIKKCFSVVLIICVGVKNTFSIFRLECRISNFLSTTKRRQQFVRERYKCANPTFKIKAGEKKVRKSKTVGKKHTPLSKLGDKVSGLGEACQDANSGLNP